MGYVRLLLAIAVLASHSRASGIPILVSGMIAVKMFYVISGYYMAMILHHKYKSKIKDFYRNRFFPAELWLFLLGSIAFLNKELIDKLIPHFVIYFFVLYTVLYNLLVNYLTPPIAEIMMYITLFFSINKLFSATQYSKIDRVLGETSYPFYLIHLFVLSVIHQLHLNKILELVIAILCTFISSYLIEKYFYTKIQRFRVILSDKRKS